VKTEFIMAVTMKNTIFWDVILCSLVDTYQNFGGISVNIQRTLLCEVPEDSILKYDKYHIELNEVVLFFL
jgi:hypothetical protein